MKEYDIAEKLFCITTDGAKNNGTMCNEISCHLKEEYDIDWNPKEMHIHCMNHVINLAVQEFLKSIKVMSRKSEESDDESDEDEDENKNQMGVLPVILTRAVGIAPCADPASCADPVPAPCTAPVLCINP